MQGNKQQSGYMSETILSKLKGRAVEQYLEEINDAFKDGRLKSLLNELSIMPKEEMAVASFLERFAIHRFVALVLDAVTTNVVDEHHDERIEYLREDEQEVIDIIKKEVVARAKVIMNEDFDDATKGE